MKRILVAEDQIEIRELIRLALELEDWEIHEAENGEGALDAALRLRPHLMLLDVMMPGKLDGYAVCERLRADPQTRRMPVVMLSARSGDEDRRRGLQAGANEYLSKPFSPRKLLSVIERLM